MLVHPQAIVSGVCIESYTPIPEHVAVIGGKQVQWHIKAHAIRGAARAPAIDGAQRQVRSVVDQIRYWD